MISKSWHQALVHIVEPRSDLQHVIEIEIVAEFTTIFITVTRFPIFFFL